MVEGITGRAIAVIGLGVSGQAVARAGKRLGAQVTVYDEKPAEQASVLTALDALESLGVDVVTGWHGRLEGEEFDVLVISPGVPMRHPAVLDAKRMNRPVWSEVEFGSRLSVVPIVGITGTNGKSTTTVMTHVILDAALRASGRGRAWLCGNIAGSGYEEQTLTDAALGATEGDVLVAEISSYQLEFVDSLRFLAGAVTNVTPDHLDRYGRFEEYFGMKMRMYHHIAAEGRAVVNGTDRSVGVELALAEVGGEERLIAFYPGGGLGTGCTQRRGDQLGLGGHTVEIASLPLNGGHDVANLMMAWELAQVVFGESELPVAALSAAQQFRGLANRMERLGSRGGVQVINNSMCTNPAAVVASSQSVGVDQVLIMGGVTKSLDFSVVGEYLRRSGHRAVLFGPIGGEFLEQLGGGWPHFATLDEAFAAAVRVCPSPGAILLSPGCASAEPYANFKERGDAFRAIAKEWLEQ